MTNYSSPYDYIRDIRYDHRIKTTSNTFLKTYYDEDLKHMGNSKDAHAIFTNLNDKSTQDKKDDLVPYEDYINASTFINTVKFNLKHSKTKYLFNNDNSCVSYKNGFFTFTIATYSDCLLNNIFKNIRFENSNDWKKIEYVELCIGGSRIEIIYSYQFPFLIKLYNLTDDSIPLFLFIKGFYRLLYHDIQISVKVKKKYILKTDPNYKQNVNIQPKKCKGAFTDVTIYFDRYQDLNSPKVNDFKSIMFDKVANIQKAAANSEGYCDNDASLLGSFDNNQIKNVKFFEEDFDFSQDIKNYFLNKNRQSDVTSYSHETYVLQCQAVNIIQPNKNGNKVTHPLNSIYRINYFIWSEKKIKNISLTLKKNNFSFIIKDLEQDENNIIKLAPSYDLTYDNLVNYGVNFSFFDFVELEYEFVNRKTEKNRIACININYLRIMCGLSGPAFA